MRADPARRVRPTLLVLLWVWVACVALAVDLFLNVPAFDRIRPRARLYGEMRRAGHEMVGEPIEEAEPVAGTASTRRPDFARGEGSPPGLRPSGATAGVNGEATAILQHGGFTAWNDPGGRPGKGEYANGEREGTWVWYWPDGSLRERREYRSGLLEGKLEAWYPDGRPQAREEYREGKPHGEWRRWYESGKPAAQENYEEGVLHGSLVRWHENGTKAMEAHFIRGSSIGPVCRWDRSGRKAEEGTIVDGKKEGPWFTWDASGKRVLQGLFEGGRALPAGPPRPPGPPR
jgi:antitoxin component YwqK of YwqJK toxin-antitoxin module